MAEHHRIHPMDVGSQPPSAPAAPPGLAPSAEKSRDIEEQQLLPQRTVPVSHLRPPKKRRSFCCRCLCWTILAFIILVVLIAATGGILYLIFDPKIPKYSVDRLTVSKFTVDNNTVSATFNVTVTARNPNKKIGIYYKDGSDLSAWYTDEMLCAGSFPVFYQGHRNTTALHLLLTGETQIGSELLTELQQQQQTGMIPLTFRGNVPVRVKLGKLKLRKVTFKVRCNLMVNSLSARNDISIRSSSCKFKLKL